MSAKPSHSQTPPVPPFENALLGPRRVVPKVHKRLLSEPPGGSDPRLPRSRAPGRSVLKVTVTSGGTHESASSRQQRRARLTPRSRGRGRAGSRWIPERSISRPPGQPRSQRGLLWGWRWGGARLRPRCAHPTCSRGPHSTCLLARRGLPAPRAHPPVPPGCRAAGSPHHRLRQRHVQPPLDCHGVSVPEGPERGSVGDRHVHIPRLRGRFRHEAQGLRSARFRSRGTPRGSAGADPRTALEDGAAPEPSGSRGEAGRGAPDRHCPGHGHGVVFPEQTPAQLSSGLLLHFPPRPPGGASMGLAAPTRPP